MADLLNYSAPPHMDVRSLIRRGMAQIDAWHAKYGDEQPAWLPPAGDVRWLEDATAYLDATALPATTSGVTAVHDAKPIMSLAEFCAECERLGVSAASLAEALSKRPEFADCLPDGVKGPEHG